MLKARRLTQAQAGELLGIPQPHVLNLLNGRARGFSAERLMEFLAALGRLAPIGYRRTGTLARSSWNQFCTSETWVTTGEGRGAGVWMT